MIKLSLLRYHFTSWRGKESTKLLMLPRGEFNMTATNLSLAGNRFARFACPATEMRMKAIHKHLH